MIMLRDDPVIEIFDSPDFPPNWIEAIDIENGEYQFCDDRGRRFVGEITGAAGFFRAAQWRLRPEGAPDIKNVLTLLERAKMIEPNDKFPDLETLKKHTTTVSSVHGVPCPTH